MASIYDYPEEFGLKIFDEIEKDADYNFDMFVIWENDNGTLFYADDSGCSCPSPFENFGLNDLEEINQDTFDSFKNAARKWNDYYGNKKVSVIELQDFIKKVKEHLN